jgi:hypothetical protein
LFILPSLPNRGSLTFITFSCVSCTSSMSFARATGQLGTKKIQA